MKRLALVLGFAACVHVAPAPRPTSPPAPVTASPPSCLQRTPNFEAKTFPPAATMVALLELHDANVDAALTQLGSYLSQDGGGLAVPTAFAVRQWTWQVPLVTAALGRIGVATERLAAIEVAGIHAWLTPLACPPDDIVDALVQRGDSPGGVTFDVRDLGELVLALPRERSQFAYDVILRPDALVLCPAAHTRALIGAWHGPGPADPLADRALALSPAPVRMAVQQTGLVAPTGALSGATDHRLRATAGGVEALRAP